MASSATVSSATVSSMVASQPIAPHSVTSHNNATSRQLKPGLEELFERGLVWKAGFLDNANSDKKQTSEAPTALAFMSTLARSDDVAPRSGAVAPRSDEVAPSESLLREKSSLKTTGKEESKFGFNIPALDSSLPASSWTKGRIHEFFFSSSLFPAVPIAVPSLLALQNHPTIFWIGRRCWPTPFFLERASPHRSSQNANANSNAPSQVHLRATKQAPTFNGQEASWLEDRCFFIDAVNRKLLLWSIETILKGTSNACLLVDCPALSFVLSRRFALAAEDKNNTLLLLQDKKQSKLSSAAFTRWEIAPLATETF